MSFIHRLPRSRSEIGRRRTFDTLITKRRHNRARVLLIRSLIETVWGKTPDSDLLLTKADITDKLETWLELHKDDLKTYFNRRSDGSNDPVAILRWLLGKVGLKLRSEQKMVNGERFRLYFLVADELNQWMALAKRCHEGRITQNGEIENKQIPVLSNSSKQKLQKRDSIALPDMPPPDIGYRNQVMSCLEMI